MLSKSVAKLHSVSYVRAAHFSFFKRQARIQATRGPPPVYQISQSDKQANMDEYYNSIGYAKLFSSEEVYSKIRD